jgi:hypothetical protein
VIIRPGARMLSSLPDGGNCLQANSPEAHAAAPARAILAIRGLRRDESCNSCKAAGVNLGSGDHRINEGGEPEKAAHSCRIHNAAAAAAK